MTLMRGGMVGPKIDNGVAADAHSTNHASEREPSSHESPTKGRAAGRRGRIALTVVALIAFAAIGVGVSQLCSNSKAPSSDSDISAEDVITESQLMDVVNVSDLSTAQFIYNGIATKYNDDGSEQYKVRYTGTVTAGVDMSQITFDVNDEEKTVTPHLPDIALSVSIEPDIDYIPSNPGSNQKEALELCQRDANDEVDGSTDIRSVAQQNLQSTVEGLIDPLLQTHGYTIEWSE